MPEVKRAEETMKERKLEREVMLEAPVDDVWKALTDAQELKKWFPLEARVTPGAGGKVFLSWGPGCEGEAEIVAWEPGKRLACNGQFALIEWTLEQRGTKTLLRLVQRGFLGAGDWENEWFDSTSYGWTFMLLSLEVALGRHRGIDRKVAWPRVQVSVTREEAYSKLMRPDGLFTADAGATLKSGETYSLATTTGESFTGQVQFVRVPRGFCLTVRELNDALLWLTIEGVADKIEVQLWLSTFGLDQAKVDAFSERWQKRLREMFDETGGRMARPVVHFEIGCTDSKKTQEFYSRLFDWKIEQQGPAAMIAAAPGGMAGHVTALGHEPHHYTIFYVDVEDVKECLDKAESLGGKTLVPPVEIPTGTFAWMQDPEGNTVGLWKAKQV